MNFSSRIPRLHNFSFRSLIRNENSAKCCKTLYRLCIVISSFGERTLHTFSYLYLLSVLFLAMEKIIARTLEPSFFIRQKVFCALCKWNRFEYLLKFHTGSLLLKLIESAQILLHGYTVSVAFRNFLASLLCLLSIIKQL